jgi:hypothetical protein
MAKEESAMVVLVRCYDDTCTLALESRLTELINEGLVAEVLHNGTWVAAEPMRPRTEIVHPALPGSRLAALVSSF